MSQCRNDYAEVLVVKHEEDLSVSLENEDVFKHLSLHQESLVTSTFSEEACSLEEHNTDAELATRSNGRFNTCLVTTDDGSCDVVP